MATRTRRFPLAPVAALTFLAATIAAAPAGAQLVINEIDYDQPGTDTAEFVEIKNVGSSGVGLAAYEVRLINGNGGGAALYQTIALPAVTLAAGDYFVVCANAANTPNCDLDVTPDTNLVQNGAPDAVALALAGGAVVDTVSYEGNSGAPYTEGSGVGLEDPGTTGSDDLGISRFPDGADTNQNNVDLSTRCITPGLANVSPSSSCPAPGAAPVLVINEIDYDQPGTDAAEFVEIKNAGPIGADLAAYELRLINGNGGGAALYQTIALPAVMLAAGDYFVVCANAANTPNCDLDVTPDTNLVQNGAPDAVALALAGGAVVDAVSYEGNSGAPYTEGSGVGLEDPGTAGSDYLGISRFPDGVDTDQNNVDLSTRCITPGLANVSPSSSCPAPGLAGLSIDDVSVTEGNVGPVLASFTVSLSAPAGAGGVTFDIATQDGTATTADNDYVARSLTGQTIPSGQSTYSFAVTVNGDPTAEPDETFLVNVTNVTGAAVADAQGVGTILNDDPIFIHDVQGSGPVSPLVGSTVLVEGVVVGDYQGSNLRGFFLEEEDVDFDADPTTSEGIFVYCNGCPTAVAEGERVRVSGLVSEFFGMTQITATAAGDVVVTAAGNHLGEVTPALIDLPVVTPSIDDYYEPREGMRVAFVDPLTVSEYFEMARFGTVELYEGSRPLQFTQTSAPSVAGYAAHLDDLARRRILLDDDNNTQNAPLALPDGSQFVFHPQANGGFSIGAQGTDFFRGGDQVLGLTGVLHWSFSGFAGTDAWRIRPTAATPASFTVANPRPPAPPLVGGAIRAVSLNLLNYFTTIDTGPDICGPAANVDCRGADSAAEFARQRDRFAVVLCGLDADVVGVTELENTTPTGAIADLVAVVNARCGGADPYAFVDTGGTLGADAIRVGLIYRSATLAPAGPPLVDLDPVHSRPPTAQTFDVVDAANPAFGFRFTAIVSHFKSKGSCPPSGADADALDGQGCFNATRTAQANRLVAWTAATVVPAAGDPDVLLLGDFNSYAEEDPIAALAAGGYTDLVDALLGPAGYTYVFDGQLGRFDYGFASASLAADTAGVGVWHIDADEVPLFDYNDEIVDAPGELSFEEKPNGSALAPPRLLFEPASPYRASDHDPVLVGLFRVADLSIAKVDGPDPVVAGTDLVYTVTVANAGPDAAAAVAWSDPLPAGTTFVSLTQPGGWTCTTPPVGSLGTVDCSIASLGVGSAVFSLTVHVDAAVPAGTVLSNTAVATATTADPDLADRTATATTTVGAQANQSLAKGAAPNPVLAGANLTYTLTATNAGPSVAVAASVTDPLPAGTTFVSLVAPGGWSCATPAVGSGGVVSCNIAAFGVGSAVFTIVVQVDPYFAPTTPLVNSATLASATPDPTPGDTVATAAVTVLAPATVTATKSVAGAFVPGSLVTYTVVLSNAGPAAQLDNPGDEFVDVLPAELTLVGASATSGAALADVPSGTVTWNGTIAAGDSVTITIEATLNYGVADGTVVSNQGVASYDADGNGSNEASAVTDDPATGAVDDPTDFVVSARPIAEIPTLDALGLALLALALAALAGRRLRRAVE